MMPKFRGNARETVGAQCTGCFQYVHWIEDAGRSRVGETFPGRCHGCDNDAAQFQVVSVVAGNIYANRGLPGVYSDCWNTAIRLDNLAKFERCNREAQRQDDIRMGREVQA